MRTLGIGVIGYGFMGRTHTYAHKTIPFYYSPLPAKCRMVAVCDQREDTAKEAVEAGGFDRWTTDPMSVVRAADVDVIHVCTPNAEHFPLLREAISAGKHIYVDKPVTASLDEAKQLMALLGAYRGTAQVALQYRGFPATLKAKQLIAEGFLGPVTHLRGAYLHAGSVDPNRAVNWKSTAAAGGGVIRDLGAHIMDVLNWLVGPPQQLSCTSRIWAATRPSADKPGEMMTIDVEDAAVMTLRYPDGALGIVEVSKIATGAEDELRFEIHGRHGAIRFNLAQPNYLEIYDNRDADGELGGRRGWQQIACIQKYAAPGGKFPGPKFSLGWIRSHVHGVYSFLENIVAGRPGSPSLEEGLLLQYQLEAARASAADNGSWSHFAEA